MIHSIQQFGLLDLWDRDPETDEDGIGMQEDILISSIMLCFRNSNRYHFKVLCNRVYVLNLITCLVDIREKSM